MTRCSIMIAFFSLGLAGACTGEFVIEEGSGGRGGAGGAGADAGYAAAADAQAVENIAARQYFESYVQPILLGVRPKGSCSLCHQGTNTANGPIFMGVGQTENYYSLISDALLIGTSAASSSLLTKGDHAGNSFCSGVGVPYNQCDTDEFAVLSDWIRLQNL